MTPETVKDFIRQGQSDTVFFLENPQNHFEIIAYTQLLIEAETGVLIIGVKQCGTVVGLRKREAEIHSLAEKAIQNTSLKAHTIQLISEFKVLVICQ